MRWLFVVSAGVGFDDGAVTLAVFDVRTFGTAVGRVRYPHQHFRWQTFVIIASVGQLAR